MNKAEAQVSSLKINTSVIALEGNEVVDLFTIDISKLILTAKLDYNLLNSSVVGRSTEDIEKLFKFRFHNNIKLFNGNTKLNFKGEEYMSLPISAEGFEYSTRGSPPSPKLSLAVRGDGNEEVEKAFKTLKIFLRDFDDLNGAKVTRVKTFSRHLDPKTWYAHLPYPDNLSNPSNILFSADHPTPSNYDPDPNAIISQDVFFIDRKSQEDKNSLVFELSTLLDLHEVKIPSRVVIERTCNWQYRGEGCCYENRSRQIKSTHGTAILPNYAPPVADEKNQRLENFSIFKDSGVKFNDRDTWKTNETYNLGDVVRILVDNVNYYFVAHTLVPKNSPPPNTKFWLQDQCSKTIEGCKLRWGPGGKVLSIGDNGYTNERLRFGGFPGVIKRGS